MDEVELSHQVVREIAAMHSLLQTLDKLDYQYFSTLDSSFNSQHIAVAQSLSSAVDSFQLLVAKNSSQQRLAVIFKSDLLLYENAYRLALNCSKTSHSDSLAQALYTSLSKPMDDALRRSDLMTENEIRTINEGALQAKKYRDATGEVMKSFGLIFSLLSLVLFFFMVREFRKRHVAQISLRQSLAELAHSKSELEQIAHVTSHDLQEPVRKIGVLIDRWRLLQKGNITPETADTIVRLNRTANRMHDLVAGLMVLTSLRDEEEKEDCPLSEIVAGILRDFKEKIEAKQGALSVGTLPTIHGEPQQLALLFRNLIENALKFSRPGVPLRIVISTLQNDSAAGKGLFPEGERYQVVAITDNGIGFDNKMAEKMFEIFQKIHDFEDTAHGVGLAIAKRIMVNHGGYITAHAFPNEGATFKLYFPA